MTNSTPNNDQELYDLWKYRIDVGKSFRKRWEEDFRIDDLDKYWEGFQRPSWWRGDFFSVNLIYANVKSQLDGFLTQDPSFSIRPSRSLQVDEQSIQALDLQTTIGESTLNYLFRENDTRQEIRKAILDAYPQFGVVKTFYEPYHTDNVKKGEPVTDGQGNAILDSETGTNAVEPDILLEKEYFKVSRRNPSFILLDPFADSIENIKWVAEHIPFTISELKDSKLFKNTEDINATDRLVQDRSDEEKRKRPDGIDAKPLTGGNSSMPTPNSSKYEEVVWVWEIYDIENKRIVCIADGHTKIIRDDETPECIEGHPYDFLFFIRRRNSAYPIPELWHQIGPQDEYNITRNQIVTHRKRFNRKYEVREGAVDDDEMAKFEEPYDGMVVKTKSDGPAFRPIADPSLDEAVYFDVEMLRKDFMDISGDSVPDSDIAKIEKASVAGLLSERMNNRRGGKITSIQEFVQRIGRKMMILIENELTIPFAIAINGPMGQTWQTVNPGDLNTSTAEFTYEVAVTSLLPRNPETERSSWIAFLQFVKLNPEVGSAPILMKKTAKMFGVEDQTLVNELIKFAQAVQQQQMMQGGQPGQPSMSGDMSKALGV